MNNPAPLTDLQRDMVQNNLGLVYVHLRHFFPNATQAHLARDRDELVQQGYLGLIKSAQTYDARCGIHFAAWALPRIRYYMATAVTNADTISTPQYRRRNRDSDGIRNGPVRTVPLTPNTPDRPASNAVNVGSARTIRVRLTELLESATAQAAAELMQLAGGAYAARALVDRVIRERVLIPDDRFHETTRNLAAAMQVTHGTVLHTEQSLKSNIRGRLQHDPELRELRRMARESPEGFDTVLDATWNVRQARAVVSRILVCWQHGDDNTLVAICRALERLSAGSLTRAVQQLVRQLHADDRVRLLRAATESADKKLRNCRAKNRNISGTKLLPYTAAKGAFAA